VVTAAASLAEATHRAASRPGAGARVGVLALQGDVREHARMLDELEARPVPVLLPDDLAGIEALVLPGGESTTISMLLESSGLFDPVAELIAEGLPVLGTCAGMILLAREILDGRDDQRSFAAIDISVRRNAFGRQVDSFESDLSVPGLGDDPLHAVFIRAPYVEAVGAGVEVLASAPLVGAGPAGERPVLCRQGCVTVAAFHPELSGDARLHELLLSDVEKG
jgi:5'-phosphate synthase pdxT subunit